MKGLLSCMILCISVTASAQQLVTLQGKAQGTYYIIKYMSTGEPVSLQAEVEDIFRDIARSMSLYVPNSLINRFNKGPKVVMDDHMRTVVKTAQEVSKLTNGLFDITVKPLVDLWGFGVIRHNNGRPSPEAIRRTMRVVGYQ